MKTKSSPKKVSTDAERQGAIPSQSVETFSVVDKFYPSEYMSNILLKLGLPKEKQDIVSIGNLLPGFIYIDTGDPQFSKYPLEIKTDAFLEIRKAYLPTTWRCGYTVLNQEYLYKSINYLGETQVEAMAKALAHLIQNKVVLLGENDYDSFLYTSLK